MKNKLLLIYRSGIEAPGIVQKMMAQQEALEALGYEVKSYNLENEGKSGFIMTTILKVLFFNKLKKIINPNDFNFVYLRFVPVGFGFIGFLKYLKYINPKIKIIIEIPTFPYESEFQGLFKRVYYNLFKIDLDQVCKYSDLILYIGENFNCKNTPSKRINNGIIKKIDFTYRDYKPMTDEYHFLALGSLYNWYGLDRFLKGIMIYKNNHNNPPRLVVHIAGDGPVKKQLIRDFCKNVEMKFYTADDSKNIQEVLKIADLGIGTLGAHRKNLYNFSPLKHREYASKGLSFLYAGFDEPFEHKNFIIKAEPDETPVDIKKILTHIDTLRTYNDNTVSEYLQHIAANMTWENEFAFLKSLLKDGE